MNDVSAYALTAPRIDTHSHFDGSMPGLREIAAGFGRFETTQPMLGSRAHAAGCRVLYGIDPGTFLQPDAPEALFAAAEALRAAGPRAAFERALDTAHITLQMAFTGHRPQDSPLPALSSRIRLVSYVDSLILGDPDAFRADDPVRPFCYYDGLCRHLGPLNSLDDYLDGLDRAIDGWRAAGVVAMKTALAYTVGLHFSDPGYDAARQAFAAREGMSPAQVRMVQDYAFRHALLACRRNGLPVIIHTGFLIWGHGALPAANPMALHNLLVDRRYRDVVFVLLHGGNPYVGETTYLAGMFPRVVLDFTWISWMSTARFRLALTEWLEAVPHDRICWGSDSSTPESIVGIDRITREQIAWVLSDMLRDGRLDERTALRFLEQAYTLTPRRVFGL